MSMYNGINEDLGDWFGKGPEGSKSGGGWDRYSTTGKKLGKCGDRKPGEGKPKCLSQKAASRLRAKGGAKEIGKAVKRKKRKDPNAERSGDPKNVNTENLLRKYVLFIENVIQEKNEPTNKKLWSSAKAAAGRKYKIKNSAYKNGYAVQWYNKRGGGWKTVNESWDRYGHGTSKNQIRIKMYRMPATIVASYPDGSKHIYKIREEHHLDYYYDMFRTKYGRDPQKLISLLKKDRVPVEVDIQESRTLSEIAGSFDSDFPRTKKFRMPHAGELPKMYSDEIADMQKDKELDKEAAYQGEDDDIDFFDEEDSPPITANRAIVLLCDDEQMSRLLLSYNIFEHLTSRLVPFPHLWSTDNPPLIMYPSSYLKGPRGDSVFLVNFFPEEELADVETAIKEYMNQYGLSAYAGEDRDHAYVNKLIEQVVNQMEEGALEFLEELYLEPIFFKR